MIDVLVIGTALLIGTLASAAGVMAAGPVLALNVLGIGTVLTVLHSAAVLGIARNREAGGTMERDLLPGIDLQSRR